MVKTLLLPGNASQDCISHLTAGGMETLPVSMGKFNSDEPFTELFFGDRAQFNANKEKLRGAHVVIVHSTDAPVAERCKQLEFAIYRLKDSGVAEITVAMPYASFDRQDREFPERFACMAAEYFPQQLKQAGADRIIRITPHSQAALNFYKNTFGEQCTSLSTTELFAQKLRERFTDLSQLSIGAPDGADKPSDEGQRRAFELAKALFGPLSEEELRKHMFFISKKHTGTSDTEITGFEGNVEGKHCVVIDDMIDGGSTMINAASRVKARGAASVSACATHAILSGNALENILSNKPDGEHVAIDSLLVTDTIPGVKDKLELLNRQKPRLAPKVEVLPVSELLSQSLQQLPALPGVRMQR